MRKKEFSSKQIIARLKEYLADHQEIEEMMLFGSAAGEDFSDSSDIDLALSLAEPMAMEEKIRYAAELEIHLGRNVDVVDLHTACGLIHYEIMTGGLPVKMTPERLARERSLALGFQADFLPQLDEYKKTCIQRFIHE